MKRSRRIFGILLILILVQLSCTIPAGIGGNKRKRLKLHWVLKQPCSRNSSRLWTPAVPATVLSPIHYIPRLPPGHQRRFHPQKQPFPQPIQKSTHSSCSVRPSRTAPSLHPGSISPRHGPSATTATMHGTRISPSLSSTATACPGPSPRNWVTQLTPVQRSRFRLTLSRRTVPANILPAGSLPLIKVMRSACCRSRLRSGSTSRAGFLNNRCVISFRE